MVKPEDFDTVILQHMRKPIDELLQKHCINMSLENQMTMRLLPYYALDILIHTNEAAGLRNKKTIKKIIDKIRLLGATERFISESIDLAVTTYDKLRKDHPDILERYKLK